MYIALKWLICLSLAMWLSICYIDMFHAKTINLYSIVNRYYKNDTQGSSTANRYQQYTESYKPKEFVILNYAMFLAGAIAVILFNRKHELIRFVKFKIKATKPHIIQVKEYIEQIDLKSTAKCFIDVMYKQTISLWGKIKSYKSTIKELGLVKIRTTESKHDRINILMILKLSETVKQNKKMVQLLLIAVQENKNLRKRFQLELMTKNRLLKHIADTQNATKESKERIVFLENLVTENRDNVLNKTRIGQLTKEKEEVEKTLIELVKIVYLSMNLELIGYCTQLIDKAKKKLSSDVTKEISKLFSNQQITISPHPKQSQQAILETIGKKVMEKCESGEMTRLSADKEETTETHEYNGLPGERILAVKDKDGLIDTIYEFNYDSDYDNGDSIRRIREYSVYCDKECYLDYKNSRTIINQRTNCTSSMRNHDVIGCKKFLTDSKLFQKFLQDNKMTVPVKPRQRIPNLTNGTYGFRNALRIDT